MREECQTLVVSLWAVCLCVRLSVFLSLYVFMCQCGFLVALSARFVHKPLACYKKGSTNTSPTFCMGLKTQIQGGLIITPNYFTGCRVRLLLPAVRPGAPGEFSGV